jgi:hypothetical protein
MGPISRVFRSGKAFHPRVMHRSSLLGQFISPIETDALQIQSLESYLQHFIFFITYKWAQLVEYLYLASLSGQIHVTY